MSAMGYHSRDPNTLRREKETALLSLGKLMHKLIRDGNITDEACFMLSERIAQIDIELCHAEGNRVPMQGEGICPNCYVPLASPMAVFCGGCGTNLTEFYSRYMTRCGKCGQLTASGGGYCTVCGVKRAASGG